MKSHDKIMEYLQELDLIKKVFEVDVKGAMLVLKDISSEKNSTIENSLENLINKSFYNQCTIITDNYVRAIEIKSLSKELNKSVDVYSFHNESSIYGCRFPNNRFIADILLPDSKIKMMKELGYDQLI